MKMWGAEMVREEDFTTEVMGLFDDNAIIDMAWRKSTQLWKFSKLRVLEVHLAVRTRWRRTLTFFFVSSFVSIKKKSESTETAMLSIFFCLG